MRVDTLSIGKEERQVLEVLQRLDNEDLDGFKWCGDCLHGESRQGQAFIFCKKFRAYANTLRRDDEACAGLHFERIGSKYK